MVAYEIQLEAEDYAEEEQNEENDDDHVAGPSFRFLLSTRRLLQIGLKSDLVQTDATYKLIWQGFPVIITGTSDQNRHFHPFGLAVCSTERGIDFEFVFKALKIAIERESPTPFEYRPKVLVADSAPAITNGFTAVFGIPEARVNCFAHVKTGKKGVANKVRRIKDVRTEGMILADIDCLQLAESEGQFIVASQLLVEKWRAGFNNDIKSFLDDFEASWLTRNRNWFEGCAPGYPSTNNAVESTNNAIKRDATIRKRLPLRQFVTLACEKIVGVWSSERSLAEANGGKTFAERPEVTLKAETAAHQWLKAKCTVKMETEGNWRHCFIPSVEFPSYPSLSAADVEAHRMMSVGNQWADFDSYKAFRLRGIWKVSLDVTDWRKGNCSCPVFAKEYICKHLIGTASRLQLHDISQVAKQVPIGQRRKPGRPKNATRALLRI